MHVDRGLGAEHSCRPTWYLSIVSTSMGGPCAASAAPALQQPASPAAAAAAGTAVAPALGAAGSAWDGAICVRRTCSRPGKLQLAACVSALAAPPAPAAPAAAAAEVPCAGLGRTSFSSRATCTRAERHSTTVKQVRSRLWCAAGCGVQQVEVPPRWSCHVRAAKGGTTTRHYKKNAVTTAR